MQNAKKPVTLRSLQRSFSHVYCRDWTRLKHVSKTLIFLRVDKTDAVHRALLEASRINWFVQHQVLCLSKHEDFQCPSGDAE